MAPTFGTILDEISRLSMEEREMLDQIIHKRIIDEKREELSEQYQAALNEYESGTAKAGTVDDLFDAISR